MQRSFNFLHLVILISVLGAACSSGKTASKRIDSAAGTAVVTLDSTAKAAADSVDSMKKKTIRR